MAIMDWATRRVLTVAQQGIENAREGATLKYAGCQLLPSRQIAWQSPAGNG